MHAEGTLTYSDGSVYEGTFFDGMKHGKGHLKQLKNAAGEVEGYNGTWYKDKKHGHGALEFSIQLLAGWLACLAWLAALAGQLWRSNATHTFLVP